MTLPIFCLCPVLRSAGNAHKSQLLGAHDHELFCAAHHSEGYRALPHDILGLTLNWDFSALAIFMKRVSVWVGAVLVVIVILIIAASYFFDLTYVDKGPFRPLRITKLNLTAKSIRIVRSKTSQRG
jgi:hypothetical protein